jgi:hypothetical protein
LLTFNNTNKCTGTGAGGAGTGIGTGVGVGTSAGSDTGIQAINNKLFRLLRWCGCSITMPKHSSGGSGVGVGARIGQCLKKCCISALATNFKTLFNFRLMLYHFSTQHSTIIFVHAPTIFLNKICLIRPPTFVVPGFGSGTVPGAGTGTSNSVTIISSFRILKRKCCNNITSEQGSGTSGRDQTEKFSIKCFISVLDNYSVKNFPFRLTVKHHCSAYNIYPVYNTYEKMSRHGHCFGEHVPTACNQCGLRHH